MLNVDDYLDRNTLLNNKYEVENIYYSFILKFFPQFTYDLFYNYIYLYSDFKNKYNNLFYLNIDNLNQAGIYLKFSTLFNIGIYRKLFGILFQYLRFKFL